MKLDEKRCRTKESGELLVGVYSSSSLRGSTADSILVHCCSMYSLSPQLVSLMSFQNNDI